MSKQLAKPGLAGPDMSDVLNMLALVKQDLLLDVAIQMRPRLTDTEVTGLNCVLRVRPLADVGTVWEEWRPLDIAFEWSARNGRTLPATLWFALFDLYSFDLPS